jgi:hypothetical protein
VYVVETAVRAEWDVGGGGRVVGGIRHHGDRTAKSQ